MSEHPPGTTPSPTPGFAGRRWLLGGLLVSLTLNLMLVGFVAGRASAGNLPGMQPPVGMMWLLRTLPEQRRDELRPLLRSHGRGLRDELRGLRRATSALVEALQAEPLDSAALQQAADVLRQHMDRTQQHTLDALVAVAAQLTPAERGHLAAAMRDAGRGDMRRGPPRYGPRHSQDGQRRFPRQERGQPPLDTPAEPEPPES